jgi:uncharacterized membrane protein YgdD (TMEM256/DUF423 family)
VNRLSLTILAIAGVAGALGVMIGAFGAHGMESHLKDIGVEADLIPKRLDQFDLGARYHLAHALALWGLANSSLLTRRSRIWVCSLLVAGILLFSGSLYLLGYLNQPRLGAVTPLGGVAWILAWISVMVSAIAARSAQKAGPNEDSQKQD